MSSTLSEMLNRCLPMNLPLLASGIVRRNAAAKYAVGFKTLKCGSPGAVEDNHSSGCSLYKSWLSGDDYLFWLRVMAKGPELRRFNPCKKEGNRSV